jgi:serine phosphatase RsbU (regulator of sigma subunit)
VAELTNTPMVPFGLGGATPELSVSDLEPGDAILLYTDGVTEARTADGDLFGLDRLIDLLEREAASEQPPEEILRRLVRAVLDYEPGGLRDDATLLLAQWTADAP